jgi:mono/diheme cytochrome c family protein
MRNWMWLPAGLAALVILLGCAAFVFLKTDTHGFSTRSPPTAFETFAARTVREMALPAGTREKLNPIPNSADVLAEGRAHWSDHCAACHSNNGSGEAEMGKHMYPPAPDMRKSDSQSLSDGELFYIIQNGIRLTGMPSWGSGTKRDEQDSWKLVRFIRHLPKLTAEEEKEMEAANPKSPDELKEEEEERNFLNGDQSNERKQHPHN